MNSQDFIAREKARIEKGVPLTERARRSVASIYVDNDKIYSYGTHYPLLWQVKTPTGVKLWVCNSSGYSATTGKHISWTGWQADIMAETIRACDTNAWQQSNRDMYRRTEYNDVLKAIQLKLAEIVDTMATKKRKDTQVYKWLKCDMQTQCEYIEKLKYSNHG